MEENGIFLIDSVSELAKNTSCSFHLEGWPAATTVICTVAIISVVYWATHKSNTSVVA